MQNLIGSKLDQKLYYWYNHQSQIKSFKFLKDLSGESESFEGVIEKKLK